MTLVCHEVIFAQKANFAKRCITCFSPKYSIQCYSYSYNTPTHYTTILDTAQQNYFLCILYMENTLAFFSDMSDTGRSSNLHMSSYVIHTCCDVLRERRRAMLSTLELEEEGSAKRQNTGCVCFLCLLHWGYHFSPVCLYVCRGSLSFMRSHLCNRPKRYEMQKISVFVRRKIILEAVPPGSHRPKLSEKGDGESRLRHRCQHR